MVDGTKEEPVDNEITFSTVTTVRQEVPDGGHSTGLSSLGPRGTSETKKKQ